MDHGMNNQNQKYILIKVYQIIYKMKKKKYRINSMDVKKNDFINDVNVILWVFFNSKNWKDFDYCGFFLKYVTCTQYYI